MKFKVQIRTIDGEEWFKFDNKFEYYRYYYGIYIMIALVMILACAFIFFVIYIIPYIDLLKNNPCDLCMEHGYNCFKTSMFR